MHIDVDHAVQFIERCLLKWLGNRRARIVDQHIDVAERFCACSTADFTACTSAASAYTAKAFRPLPSIVLTTPSLSYLFTQRPFFPIL